MVQDNISSNRPRQRLLHIDVAKGLGMLLVVYGHLVQANSPGESAWYVTTRDIVYTFHMPFFLYLSGYVFFLTNAHLRLGRAWQSLVKSRADRLLVPFAFFGIVIILGKSVAAQFGEVHKGVGNIATGLWRVLSNTPDNPNISIWYLLVLFTYSLVTPFLFARFRGKMAWLIGAALIVSMAAEYFVVTERFYIARLLRYYVFFAVGGWAWLHWDWCVSRIKRWWLPLTLLFAAAASQGPWHPFALLYCGLLSIPALHGAMLFPAAQRSRLLQVVGANSMAIYLMNTICIGVAKLIWLRLFPADGAWNAPFLSVLMLAGIIGPIVARAVIVRLPVVRRVGKYIA